MGCTLQGRAASLLHASETSGSPGTAGTRQQNALINGSQFLQHLCEGRWGDRS